MFQSPGEIKVGSFGAVIFYERNVAVFLGPQP